MAAKSQDQITSPSAEAISLIKKHRARPTPDQVAAARDLSLFVIFGAYHHKSIGILYFLCQMVELRRCFTFRIGKVRLENGFKRII